MLLRMNVVIATGILPFLVTFVSSIGGIEGGSSSQYWPLSTHQNFYRPSTDASKASSETFYNYPVADSAHPYMFYSAVSPIARSYGEPQSGTRTKRLTVNSTYRDYYGNAYRPHGYGHGSHTSSYGHGYNGGNYACPFYRDYFAYLKSFWPQRNIYDQSVHMTQDAPSQSIRQKSSRFKIKPNRETSMPRKPSANSRNSTRRETAKHNTQNISERNNDNYIVVYDRKQGRNKLSDDIFKNAKIKYFRCRKVTDRWENFYGYSEDVFEIDRKYKDENNQLKDILCEIVNSDSEEDNNRNKGSYISSNRKRSSNNTHKKVKHDMQSTSRSYGGRQRYYDTQEPEETRHTFQPNMQIILRGNSENYNKHYGERSSNKFQME